MSSSIANPNAQAPHPIPPEAVPFLESLTTEQRELHELAVQLLGSSYYVDRCHAFRKWKAAQQPPAK